MPDFLEAAADRIPTLAGDQVHQPDLMAYQPLPADVTAGRFDVPWGVDEALLGALAVGAAAASAAATTSPRRSTRRSAFERGDLETARRRKEQSIAMVDALRRRAATWPPPRR